MSQNILPLRSSQVTEPRKGAWFVGCPGTMPRAVYKAATSPSVPDRSTSSRPCCPSTVCVRRQAAEPDRCCAHAVEDAAVVVAEGGVVDDHRAEVQRRLAFRQLEHLDGQQQSAVDQPERRGWGKSGGDRQRQGAHHAR